MFKMDDVQALVKMGLDLVKGQRTMEKEPTKFTLIENKYSVEEANDIFNKKLIKTACETANLPYEDGKMTWYKFSSPTFQHAFFNLISVVIDAILPKVLTTQFDMLTEVKNAAWGDKLIMEVTSPDYFSVSKVANGTTNLRRQRLDRRTKELAPVMRGVSISENLFRVLAGKVDWATWINKAAISMATAIKKDVYDAIYASYSDLSATYGTTGAFDGTTLVTMAEHVKAANGGLQPIILGTALALSNVLPATGVSGMTSFNMMD